MRRPTYKELEQEKSRLDKQATLCQLALNATLNGVAEAHQEAKANGDRWLFRLYDATRAHGGIVIETFRTKGQNPSTTVHYLEDVSRDTNLHGDLSEEFIARRTAVSNLVIERNKLAGY